MNYKTLTIAFGVLILSSVASMALLTNPSFIIHGQYDRVQLITGFIISMSVFLCGLIGSIVSFSLYVTTTGESQ